MSEHTDQTEEREGQSEAGEDAPVDDEDAAEQLQDDEQLERNEP